MKRILALAYVTFLATSSSHATPPFPSLVSTTTSAVATGGGPAVPSDGPLAPTAPIPLVPNPLQSVLPGLVLLAPPPVEPLRVTYMGLKFMDGNERFGGKPAVGTSLWTGAWPQVLFEDMAAIKVELSEPAYTYVLMFRGDGKVELIHPVDESTAPPLSATAHYPLFPGARDASFYGFSDGKKGEQWAVLALASRKKLPAYEKWEKASKEWRSPKPLSFDWKDYNDGLRLAYLASEYLLPREADKKDAEAVIKTLLEQKGSAEAYGALLFVVK